MTGAPYANTPIVKLLRDRRDALSHRKSQAAIAAEIGYGIPNHVSNIIHGRHALPADRFPAAMEALEVPAEQRGEYFITALGSYRDNRAWASMGECLRFLTDEQVRAIIADLNLSKTRPVAIGTKARKPESK